MKLKLVGLIAVAVLLLGARPAFAEDMTMCNTPTIAALQDCVNHAVTMGHIDNAGVAHSLQAKLGAAQAAQDRGQVGVAVNVLGAFINEVQAQSGQHIQAEHAAHMIMHAQMVIEALTHP
jgi:hypothetical protein